MPVETVHVGWVISSVAAAGAPAAALIITSADADEVHPAAFLTVKLCVPADKPGMVVVAVLPVIPPG